LGIAVVFLRVGCAQADFSDMVPAMRDAVRLFGAVDGSTACEVIPELLRDGDLTLLKTGSGGFNSSPLDVRLRNMGITHVIYTGVITNACVLLTCAAGFDLGYHGYLVSDATATFDAELQRQSENLIGQFMAKVTTTDDLLSEIYGLLGLDVAGKPARNVP
jgi:biuret amidohydrolase